MSRAVTELNQITREVIGAAIEVHRQLGPGLLESSYRECLCRELVLRGIPFEREKPLPLEYKGIHLGCGYRLDLLVAGAVVVEIKSVEALAPIHDAQLLTYLRITKIPHEVRLIFAISLISGSYQSFTFCIIF